MEEYSCRGLANSILQSIVQSKTPKTKKLCIISVGDDPASEVYMRQKKKACETCGIPYEHKVIKESEFTAEDLEYAIMYANSDPSVGGIILQLPLPKPFTKEDEVKYTHMIAREKDVDGFRPDSPFLPCTPEGIIRVMKHYYQTDNLTGKNVLLVGKGELVGRPLGEILLFDEGCKVQCIASKTEWEDKMDALYTQPHNVVITGTGGNFKVYPAEMDCDLVIDASIYRDEETGKLMGDCITDWDAEVACFVTPVPGGVGPMTVAMLMLHMMKVQ